jgi:hypothetical protein
MIRERLQPQVAIVPIIYLCYHYKSHEGSFSWLQGLAILALHKLNRQPYLLSVSDPSDVTPFLDTLLKNCT